MMLSNVGRCSLWIAAIALLGSAPAVASPITITGLDEQSQYIGAGSADPSAGLMTFTFGGDDSGIVNVVDGASTLR